MRPLTALVLHLTLTFTPSGPIPDTTPPQSAGYAWEYRPGLMERVAAHRGIGWTPGILGFVAVPQCRHVGQWVYARVGTEIGWWRVVDCSDPRDLRVQSYKADVIEVSFSVALRGRWDTYRLGGPGHIRAIVYAYHKGNPYAAPPTARPHGQPPRATVLPPRPTVRPGAVPDAAAALPPYSGSSRFHAPGGGP